MNPITQSIKWGAGRLVQSGTSCRSICSRPPPLAHYSQQHSNTEQTPPQDRRWCVQVRVPFPCEDPVTCAVHWLCIKNHLILIILELFAINHCGTSVCFSNVRRCCHSASRRQLLHVCTHARTHTHTNRQYLKGWSQDHLLQVS